jgi:methionyl aminopeptidase
LDAAVEAAQCGERLRDIAAAIHRTVEGSLSECKTGIRVIRDLAGHGVGCEVHEPPSIPNYAPDCDGRLRLAEGMTLAIEPMTSLGAATTKRCPIDRWGARTTDGAWSAHFEHTVHIRRGTPEVLTTCEE